MFDTVEAYKAQTQLIKGVCEVLNEQGCIALIEMLISSELRSGNLSLDAARTILWDLDFPAESMPSRIMSTKCQHGNHDGCALDFVQIVLGCACPCHKEKTNG